MVSSITGPDDLARSFEGTLLGPEDPGYDEARRVHNGLIDKHPALIARCRSTTDVVAAIHLARDQELEISVRGGGHNVAGRAVTDGGLMIDLAPMKAIYVDPDERTVQAGGGVVWGELDRATHEHGLMTPGGVVSSTGIAGLTLGGGLGWTQGRYGLAVDNLIAAEVVTAYGRVLVTSEDQHPDLFWALRGGGGNFGVVTRFTYRAHALSTVLGGSVVYPGDETRHVLETYRDLAATAPDELSVQVGLFHTPDESAMPVAGISLCHCGDDPDEAEAAAAPLRRAGAPLLDTVERIPYPQMNALTDVLFPGGARNYWKQAFVGDISDPVVDTLVDAFADCPSNMTVLVVEPLHGAAARVPVDATAFPYRDEGYAVLLCGQWRDPDDTQANITWTRETFDSLRPHLSSRRYVNYMSDDDSTIAAYGPNYRRLVEIKRRYDPDNVFRLNQNIDPKG
jgi:FAD/FMN-containing dehydrogenase